jgi:hypothetical protein
MTTQDTLLSSKSQAPIRKLPGGKIFKAGCRQAAAGAVSLCKRKRNLD